MTIQQSLMRTCEPLVSRLHRGFGRTSHTCRPEDEGAQTDCAAENWTHRDGTHTEKAKEERPE